MSKENWQGPYEQNILFLPDEAKMVRKPMAAMIWRNCSPISSSSSSLTHSSSSSLTGSSSASHPHPCSRCKFVLVQARPQLINRSRFLSPPSSSSEHLPPQGGETPAKPEQPITSPPAKHPSTHQSLTLTRAGTWCPG